MTHRPTTITSTNKLTRNRTIRKAAENKTGPKGTHDRTDTMTQKLFSYNTIDCYNKLHRSLTLTQSKTKFKKYLKNYLMYQTLPSIYYTKQNTQTPTNIPNDCNE